MTNTHNSNSTRQQTKHRPSVALVLAFVALLAALSNGAYAVTAAQKNSVTSKSLKSSYRTTNGWTAKGLVDMGAQGTIKLRVYALGRDTLRRPRSAPAATSG